MANKTPISSPLLTRTEAAAYLRVKPATLKTWLETGRYDLPVHKVGTRCMYRVEDLEAWLESRKTTSSLNPVD